jgi:hypothetical protein
MRVAAVCPEEGSDDAPRDQHNDEHDDCHDRYHHFVRTAD